MLPWRGYYINPSPFIFSLINHSNTSLSLSLALPLSFSLWPKPPSGAAGHQAASTPRPPATPCATTQPPLSLSLLSWPNHTTLADRIQPRPAPPSVDLSTRIVDSTRGLDLIQEVKGLDLALKTSTCSIEGLRWTNWRPRLLSRFGEEGSRKTRCQQPNLAPIVGEVKAYIILVGLNAS